MADRRTIYRITHERYSGEPFSGKGGLHYRSRWASKGRLVSYASDHLATATLEKIAGVGRADLLTEMIYVKAEVAPELVGELPEEDLPEDWDALPPTDATRQVG
ncbi:MAG: RES family NAD+ phosphorylase, partial [Candidatus Bipolaricaulia bacterium]